MSEFFNNVEDGEEDAVKEDGVEEQEEVVDDEGDEDDEDYAEKESA